MANDVLGIQYTTGNNVYFFIRDRDGNIADVATDLAFETYSTAAIADYDVAGTEQGTASGYYTAQLPSWIVDGLYHVTAYDRAGGSPAEGDACIGSQMLDVVNAGAAPEMVSIPDNFLSAALNLTATGNIGIDWANVENQSTSVNLSATTTNLVNTTTTNSDQRGTDSAMAATEDGSSFTALNDPTAAAIADQVWEEAIADHSGTSGSTAEALAAASSAGDPWSTALPGAYGGGTAGFILGTNLDAVISARTLAAASYFDPAADTVANVTLVATTTDLTNLPSITSNWLTAAGIAASALDGKGDWNTTTPPTAAAITDAVWDEATSGHTTPGTYGKAVGDGVTTWVTAAGFSTHSAADVWTSGTRTLSAATNITSDASAITMSSSGVVGTVNLVNTLTTYTGNTPQTADHTAGIADIPTVAEFNARTLAAASYFDPAADTVANVTLVATTTDLTNLPAITSNWLTAAGIAASALDGKGDWNTTTPPTVGAIADQVWLETLADHSGSSGSTAEALNAAGAAGDPWSTALPGAYGAGSAGYLIGNMNDFDPASDTVVNVTTVATTTNLTNLPSITSNWLTAAGIAASALDGKGDWNTTTPPTAAAITDAVWDEATSGHTTAGTYGKAVGDGVTTWVTATGFSTHSAADVWTSGTRTLSALGFTLAAGDFGASSLDGKGDWNTTTPPTAAAVADQVWEEAIADHSGTSGSTAEALDNATAPTAAAVADAVWDEAYAGHTSAGTFGKAVGDGVTTWVTATGFSTHAAADVWSVATRALTDKAGFTISGTITTLDALDTAQDTQHSTTQSAVAALNDLSQANIRTAVGLASANLDTQLSTIDTVVDSNATAIAALNDLSAADIWTTALTEAYGTDGSAMTGAQLLYIINAHVGEFDLTLTTKTLRQLDGTTTAATFTLNDADDPTSVTRAT
jgi:hypothetical protein